MKTEKKDVFCSIKSQFTLNGFQLIFALLLFPTFYYIYLDKLFTATQNDINLHLPFIYSHFLLVK